MSLSNLSFRTKLWLLPVIALVALAITHYSYLMTLSSVRINGSLYDRITRGRAIFNDLVLPSVNASGAYFHTLRALDLASLAERKKCFEHFSEIEAAGAKNVAAWKTEMTDVQLRELVTVKQFSALQKFLAIAKERVWPKLLEAEGLPDAEMRSQIVQALDPAYLEQLKIVEDVVMRVQDRNRDDELMALANERFWYWLIGLSSVLGILILFAASTVLVSSVTQPADRMLERLTDMAEGSADLTKRVQVDSKDELGRMGGLVNKVIGRVHDLIASIRVSTIGLNTTATEIAAAATEQNGAVQSFGASSNQIAAAVAEITATGQELSRTMEEVNTRAVEASSLANVGRNDLHQMESTMQQLVEATGSISNKLNVIRDKASGINSVVTTITKVADQTNLLSINAAIEAEKAGEAGRGFLVVAREIRRLADQTAVATLDIEQMVRHMQSAVSTGVMEMDRFSDQVRTCIHQVGSVGTQMGKIIDEVQVVGERFRIVRDGVRQQADGASQIDDAMSQLIGGVKQVRDSATEFRSAAESLRESASGLQSELSQFTVAG